MIDNKIELSLITVNKSGTLSSIMMQGDSLGLMYHQHQIEAINENQSRLNIIFEGCLKCTEETLREKIEAHLDVISIESIIIGESAITDSATIGTNKKISSEFATLRAHYVTTPESLQIAEEKLTVILGTSAKFIVESAAKKTKHIGDLYLVCAEKLEGEERSKFLALVSDMDLDKLG